MSNNANLWAQLETLRMLRGAPGTIYQEASDAERTIMRDWIRTLLQSQPITVTFFKADGTERDMLCTLNWDLIPADKHPGQPPVDGIVKESRQRREPDVHSLRVFDMDKQEWRSFRFDRLKTICAEIRFG